MPNLDHDPQTPTDPAEFTDMKGKPLVKGAEIAYATRVGNSARLNFGTIEMVDPIVPNDTGRGYGRYMRESHRTKASPTTYYLGADPTKACVLVVNRAEGGTATVQNIHNVVVL